MLFEYWDGKEKRAADPMRIFRAILNDEEFRADVHPVLADDGDDEATEVCLQAFRRAFDVREYDEDSGAGLTEIETLQLYVAFCLYMEDLKKNTSHSPTSPESTDATSQPSSEPTTKNSSVSGSTDPDPNSGKPTESVAP